MDSGKVRWKNRMTFPDTYTTACELEDPGDYCPGKGTTALDADFGASANVITVRGKTLVTIGQKNGMFYAFDARNGRIEWQTELAPVRTVASVSSGAACSTAGTSTARRGRRPVPPDQARRRPTAGSSGSPRTRPTAAPPAARRSSATCARDLHPGAERLARA